MSKLVTKDPQTTTSLTSQLRRSYIILCSLIIVFFLFYTAQAIFLNERSVKLDRALKADQQEIQAVHTLILKQNEFDINYQQYQIYPTDANKEKLADLTAQLQDAVEGLKQLKDFNESQVRIVQKAEVLFNDKISLANNALVSGENTNDKILSISDSINTYLGQLQQVESREIIVRTGETRSYNNYRIFVSILSYVIISILLVFVLFKINQNIRRRLLAEERARINEGKYKTLIEDSGIKTLVINDKGYIKFANKNIEILTGYKPDEIVGLPLQRGIEKKFLFIVDEVIRALNRTGKYDNTIELQLKNRNGKKKWVLCKIFPVNTDNNEKKEWQVVVWDIDEEKKIHLELEQLELQRKDQQKLIQDIIDNIPSIIFIKDISGKYVLINKRMEEHMARKAKEILGRTDDELVEDKDKHGAYRYTDERVLTTGQLTTMEDEVTIRSRKHYLLISKFPLFDDAGKVKNICGMATDITEQKESENHLINAKREAETARAAQETFLANMSHEIRTPMNGIMGMSNLLLTASLNEEQKEYVESIQDSGRNLLSIINDLLDFSKIKSGKFQFDNTPFKLKHAIRKALYPLQMKAEEKLLKLEVDFDEHVPDVVIGDPVRLQQIIINLAGNAVKFTSHGVVKVNVTCGAKTDTNALVRIDVIDSGIGIAAEKLDYIFESFTQNNVNTSRKYGGTGLGLAIVKQLTELQSGDVMVRSTLGKGSEFSVAIPFKIDRHAQVKESSYVGMDMGRNDLLMGIKVLVAEDNLINQKVVLNTLKRQGANVKMVLNGQEAIEEVRGNIFDVILMDLQMPEIDGYKATRYIRQKLNSNVPILAMTADALKGEAEKCFEAGMVGFISKPFDPYDLYMQILRVTGEKEDYIINKQPQENAMADELIDFSFLFDVSGGDSKYIYELIEIFMGSTPPGLQELKKLVDETDDWQAIGRQAHFLKSSVSVIKIRGVYEKLAEIERISFSEPDKPAVKQLLDDVFVTFNEALPELTAEQEKHKPA